MLEALDQKQRDYAKRRRLVDQERGPSSVEIVSALLQQIEVEGETQDAPGPLDLVDQVRELLKRKGSVINPPSGGFRIQLGSLKDPYIEIPYASIEIGGRRVRMAIGEPARLHRRYFTGPESVTGFGIDLALKIGDDYLDMQDALIIRPGGVGLYDDTTLTAQSDLRRVSALLTMVDRSLPAKA